MLRLSQGLALNYKASIFRAVNEGQRHPEAGGSYVSVSAIPQDNGRSETP